MNKTIERCSVLGVGIDCVTVSSAVDTILHWVEQREMRTVLCRDSRGLVMCRDDPQFRRYHEEAGLVTPDGMPLVWLARARGSGRVERVCGPDLMHALCAASAGTPVRHFFYGTTLDTNVRLITRLTQRYPGLNVAGYLAPPFRPLTAAEAGEHVALINAARPDIVWVGLGCPKQEHWIGEHRPLLNAPAIIGAGAAFDWVAGTKPRAPRFIQFSGLEWAFRLALEPRRLWRRTLVDNRRFLGLLLRECLASPEPAKLPGTIR